MDSGCQRRGDGDNTKGEGEGDSRGREEETLGRLLVMERGRKTMRQNRRRLKTEVGARFTETETVIPAQ